jgi:hypothetical protein
MIESFCEDLRYAIGSALKRPGFALVAIFNLAIGIGVNTAVFTVVNAVLLRQLGYAEPSALVRVRERWAVRTGKHQGISDILPDLAGMLGAFLGSYSLTLPLVAMHSGTSFALESVRGLRRVLLLLLLLPVGLVSPITKHSKVLALQW